MRVLYAAAGVAALLASVPAGAATYYFNISTPAVSGVLAYQEVPVSGITLNEGDVVDVTVTFDGSPMAIPANWQALMQTTILAPVGMFGSFTTSFTNELIGASGPSPYPAAGQANLINGLVADVTQGSLIVVPQAITYSGVHQTLTFVSGPSFAPRLIVFAANAVPEPASWALMIAGFGLAGAATRRRRAPAFRGYTTAP